MEEWLYYNFAVGSFYTKKLYQTEIEFYLFRTKIVFLSHPLGDLGVTYTLGMGGTQNFVHGICREKIPRYRVYRGTCFVVVVAKAEHAQQSN